MTSYIFTTAERYLLRFIQGRHYHGIDNLLTQKKADVNARGGNITPMQALMDSLKIYPQKNKKQTRKQFSQKLEKSAYDRIEEVEIFNLMVSHGLDLSLKDRDGNSYLVTAAAKGRVDMMQALVDAGLPISKEDVKLAKEAAAQNNYPQAEKYLVTLNRLRRKASKQIAKTSGTLARFVVLGKVLGAHLPTGKTVQNPSTHSFVAAKQAQSLGR